MLNRVQEQTGKDMIEIQNMFHCSLIEYLRFHVYKEITFQLWGLSELAVV